MSIHLPESHYTLTTLVTPKDTPSQALSQNLIKAAQILIESVIEVTGKIPWVKELNLRENLEFYCQNEIRMDKEVLKMETSEESAAEKENHPSPQKRRPKRKPQMKRPTGGRKVLTSSRKNLKKRLEIKTRKCLKKLSRNGFAVRIVINRYEEITIFLVPVLFCPDCRKRREFDFFKKLQYCHRVLTLEMIKRCRFTSEVYEKLLTEEFVALVEAGEVVVYLEEEQAEAIKQDFQKNVDYAQTLVQGPMGLPPKTIQTTLKKGEKPDRKDARRHRLARMAAWVQAFVTRFTETACDVKNWYSLLRLRCSDLNGDPLWKNGSTFTESPTWEPFSYRLSGGKL